jgi:hypothetical protein
MAERLRGLLSQHSELLRENIGLKKENDRLEKENFRLDCLLNCHSKERSGVLAICDQR